MIYKILRLDEWQSFQSLRVFMGSADDQRDGFIHFSTRDQLLGTLNKHYANEDIVVLAAVDDALLTDGLKWEISRGGQKFPHLYDDLALSSVHMHWKIERSDDGFDLAALDVSP